MKLLGFTLLIVIPFREDSILYSQTSDGRFFCGGGLGYYYEYFKDNEESEDDQKYSDFGISVNAGYKLSSDISVGSQIEYTTSKFDKRYSIGGFIRYTILEKKKNIIYLQISGSLGKGNWTLTKNPNRDKKYNYREFVFGPGYMYHFNKKTSLRFSLGEMKWYYKDLKVENLGVLPNPVVPKSYFEINIFSSVSLGLQYNF